MIYLVLAILSSSLISVLMRLSEKYTRGGMGMLAMNYLMCAILSIALVGPGNLFSQAPGFPMALGLGALNGGIYLLSFSLLRWNISRNGVVLPNMFMKLGVLVPTLMSIVVFREQPRFTQVLGFIAAIAAICLMQDRRQQGEKVHLWELVVLLLAGGTADGMSKVYEEVGPALFKDQFLAFTFIVALILCTAICFIKKQPLTPAAALFGLAIGVPNYFSSRFLLLSLSQVPAVVAYPSFSVGVIVLVTLMGVLAFKEKLSRRKLIAMGMIMAALALLNL